MTLRLLCELVGIDLSSGPACTAFPIVSAHCTSVKQFVHILHISGITNATRVDAYCLMYTQSCIMGTPFGLVRLATRVAWRLLIRRENGVDALGGAVN